MKRLQVYLTAVAALALVLGVAMRAPAQTYSAAQPGLLQVGGYGFFDEHHNHEYWEGMRHTAEDNGFRDGMQDGRSDFFSHRGFRMERNGAYRNADHGYDRQFGDRGRYQEFYREAYRRGYEEGYHGRH